MEQYSIFVCLLVMCTLCNVCSATCDDFIMETTSGNENKYVNATAPYFTYTDQSTNIKCSFDCVVSCIKIYLIFSKDGEPVYSIDWQSTGIGNGTAANFTGKVELISQDEVTNTYVLQWINATWQDVEPGRSDVVWTCTAATTSCTFRENSTSIGYFTYPELYMYGHGRILKEDSDLPSAEGTATCSVISHPESQITMLEGNDELPSTSSCIPSPTGHEFNCSISAQLGFEKGFQCIVRYSSPETGVTQEVKPGGCCTEGLFPINAGLAVWAIVLIVLAVLAVVCGGIGGGYYYINNRSGSGSSA